MSFGRYETARTEAVDNSAWRSILVFAELAGKWWFSAWILTLLSGLLSFALTISNIAPFKPAAWIALLSLGLVFAPTVAFHLLRIQRDEFKALWDDKQRVLSVLEELERFRALAAQLQIYGMSFASAGLLNTWIAGVDHWRSDTHEAIHKLHPAEAGNFNTLGIFDPKLVQGTKIFNLAHQQALINLIRRIHILDEIRDRWTTRLG